VGLRRYQEKRDFKNTPEPRGRVAPAGGRLSFVIQKHAASRLHYDFRLEAEGVLKSWAVPKGPSLDPREKRLAVEVEDHPIEYGDFEGIIPKGEYGGGTVLLWDRGRWIPEGDPLEGLRKGSLKFRLDGEKLQGGWMLVRLKDRDGEDGRKNWLLFKEKDEHARPLSEGDVLVERPESVASGRDLETIGSAAESVWNSNRPPKESGNGHGLRGRVAAAARSAAKSRPAAKKKGAPASPPKSRTKSKAAGDDLVTLPGARKAPLPRDLRPELATLVKDPPEGDDWLHEIKFDGFRALAFLEKGRATFITRNGKDWTDRFEPLPDAVAALPARSAILDGEIVVLVDNRSSFQALQGVLSGSGHRGLVLFLFDLLYLDGYDLTAVPLELRKEKLKSLLVDVEPEGPLRYSDHVTGGGPAFHREACRMKLEGMVSKRREAPYRTGRARDWLKVKCVNRQEFVIGGYTEPAGARSGLGALMVGVYDGDDLRFAGKVGTGFSAELLDTLSTRLRRLEQKTPPFSNPPRGAAARSVHWVRPELVGEVSFTEWTDDGLLRHPSFQGIREDKSPREVRREKPVDDPGAAAARPMRAGARRAPAKRAGKAVDDDDSMVAGVRLTNPQRILYPEQGLTKRDLALYYEAVAEWMLPHVAGRPLTIVRCPEGRDKACFYQKHVGQGVPDVIDSVDVRESDGKIGKYLVVHDLPGLVALVQIGVLEVHTWGARADELEKPDRLVFDLDPDPDLPWKRVVEAALNVRDRLEDLGLTSWVKTTGGKGLHVVAPIARRLDWELVKQFCLAVARSVVAAAPDQYTDVASKARRKGKIYVDYLRNSRGATFIAPCSTRAREGAPVSAPLRWDELSDRFVKYDVRTFPGRLRKLRRDPWEGFLEVRQSITQAAVRKLAGG
jgi:bifunctional non-homologous end joining protein LigD